MTTPKQTAAYLWRLAADESEPVYLTHLHVQKLVYYCQGWSLALRDREVFSEQIVAWKHGPVVCSLYGQLKEFGNTPITDMDASVACSIDANDKFLIASVWEKYKGFSAIQLRNMTHREPPWQKARVGIPADANKNVEITRDSMKEFFVSELDKAKAPVTTQVDWNQSLPDGTQPDAKFLEAVQAVFVADAELLKRLAS